VASTDQHPAADANASPVRYGLSMLNGNEYSSDGFRWINNAGHYGCSSQGSLGGIEAAPIPSHGFRYTLNLVLPPLGAVFFKCGGSS
jgi:hypothetical protein